MKLYSNRYITSSVDYEGNREADGAVFEAETRDCRVDENSLIFAFEGSDMLLSGGSVPEYGIIRQMNLKTGPLRYIGRAAKASCFATQIHPGERKAFSNDFVTLRKLYLMLPEAHLRAAVYGHQIVRWSRKNKYCGACGAETEGSLPNVLVKRCPSCSEEYYPKISPSVIVAVVDKDRILLAQHRRVTNGMPTVLAGFVDPGETLEECIHRELREEAGIEVNNIRYYGSQPWPFPDSLMIGFIADYAGGELKADRNEILELKWFRAGEIPDWPDKVSIARSLIDWFIENAGRDNQ